MTDNFNNGPWGKRPDAGKNSSGGGNPFGGGGKNGGKNEPPQDLDEAIKKLKENFQNMFGGGGGSSFGGGSANNGNGIAGGGMRAAGIAISALILLWAASGLYRVDADEQGVVLRFGKYDRTSGSGLNYHLPYPFETANVLRVTTINRAEIGFRSGSTGNTGTSNESRTPMLEESLMLTSDKNIVNAQFEVQWLIKDAGKFLFSLRDPESIVKPVAETAMREVMGNTPLTLALSDKRQEMANSTRTLMQEMLNQYGTGIEVHEVNLLAVDAPAPVVDAFIDVLAAQQEKETLQNQAHKYRDGILPVAQGQVEKMVKDAEGYKTSVVSKAEGDAARFNSVYQAYVQAKDVTKQRIYLETMEEILSDMPKMLLSGKNGVQPYLPLPALAKKEKSSTEKTEVK